MVISCTSHIYDICTKPDHYCTWAITHKIPLKVNRDKWDIDPLTAEVNHLTARTISKVSFCIAGRYIWLYYAITPDNIIEPHDFCWITVDWMFCFEKFSYLLVESHYLKYWIKLPRNLDQVLVIGIFSEAQRLRTHVDSANSEQDYLHQDSDNNWHS